MNKKRGLLSGLAIVAATCLALTGCSGSGSEPEVAENPEFADGTTMAKLADAGTRGLHGGPGKLASNRKTRLVEHALSTRLVAVQDLALLDHPTE